MKPEVEVLATTVLQKDRVGLYLTKDRFDKQVLAHHTGNGSYVFNNK